MAPPDSPFRCICTDSDALPGDTTIGGGVCVTVCVTAEPDTVVTRRLVTGDGVADELVVESELVVK